MRANESRIRSGSHRLDNNTAALVNEDSTGSSVAATLAPSAAKPLLSARGLASLRPSAAQTSAACRRRRASSLLRSAAQSGFLMIGCAVAHYYNSRSAAPLSVPSCAEPHVLPSKSRLARWPMATAVILGRLRPFNRSRRAVERAHLWLKPCFLSPAISSMPRPYVRASKSRSIHRSVDRPELQAAPSSTETRCFG